MQSMFVPVNILCICLLGFFTSYTDLKSGLIKNWAVFASIAASFALNLLNGFSMPAFLLNGFFAFVFGFVLWRASLWSAGDAKLFLALALLFPLPFHLSSSFFPALNILINSFLPAFALMLAIVLARASNSQKLEALKAAFSPGTVASVAVFLFCFYWLFDLAIPFIPVQLDLFTLAIIIFALVSLVEFLLPKKSILLFAAISLAIIVLMPERVFSAGFLLFFIPFLLLALFLMFFVLRLGFSCFGKPRKLGELAVGMVLLEAIVERNGRLEKKKPFLPSFVNILSEAKEKSAVETGPKGLGAEDIALLKKAQAEGRVAFGSILVQETLPFAPLIFAGTLLSFFLPGFF